MSSHICVAQACWLKADLATCLLPHQPVEAIWLAQLPGWAHPLSAIITTTPLKDLPDENSLHRGGRPFFRLECVYSHVR